MQKKFAQAIASCVCDITRAATKLTLAHEGIIKLDLHALRALEIKCQEATDNIAALLQQPGASWDAPRTPSGSLSPADLGEKVK